MSITLDLSFAVTFMIIFAAVFSFATDVGGC